MLACGRKQFLVCGRMITLIGLQMYYGFHRYNFKLPVVEATLRSIAI